MLFGSNCICIHVWSPFIVSAMTDQTDQAKARKRSKCDHGVTVQQCMDVLHAWLGTSRDLASRLAKTDEKWKTVPHHSQIAAYSDLMLLLADISPTILLPPTVCRNAILSLEQEKGPVNFSGKKLEDFADEYSGRLRCLCSKFRRLENTIDRNRLYRHLTVAQQDEVEQVV